MANIYDIQNIQKNGQVVDEPKKLDSIEIAQKLAATDWKLFQLLINTTIHIYYIQIFFGILTLIGMLIMAGLNDNWFVNTITFGTLTEAGAAIFIVGIVGAFICGVVSFLIATALIVSRGISILGGICIAILSVCLVGLLCPVINILPIMWLWCLYVVIHNK